MVEICIVAIFVGCSARLETLLDWSHFWNAVPALEGPNLKWMKTKRIRFFWLGDRLIFALGPPAQINDDIFLLMTYLV